MIDKGFIHRCGALSDVTNQEIALKIEELNAIPDTQVFATQIEKRPDKLQPQDNVRYDAWFHYKVKSNVSDAITKEIGKDIKRFDKEQQSRVTTIPKPVKTYPGVKLVM